MLWLRPMKKEQKKGLPPIDEKTVENRLKLMQAKEDSEEKKRMEKIAKQKSEDKRIYRLLQSKCERGLISQQGKHGTALQ